MGSMRDEARQALSGGRTIGVAMGVIRINTGQLLTDADRAKSAFKAISDSGKQIGVGVEAGTKQAESSLTSLNNTASGVLKSLVGLFALPTAIGFTQSLQRAEFQLKLFSKDANEFNQRIKQAHDLAEDLKQPYDQVLSTFSALSSLVKRYNIDLTETTKLTQRLALKSPEQTPEMARIALEEFASGNVRSLSARFELSSSDLTQIVNQANGDIKKQFELLDQYVAKLGFTNEALKEMGDQGFNAFARLKSEVKETTADAFEPFLNNALIPLAEGTGDFLQELRKLNPELLDIAGTLSGILLTVTAINAAGLGSTGLSAFAAAGAAGFVGLEAGTALARAGAEAGTVKDDRLKNVSQEEAKKVIEENFKQAVVILASGLVDVGMKLAEGAIIIGNGAERARVAFEMLKLGFKMGETVVLTGFNNFLTILSNGADKVAAALELMALDFRDAIASAITAIGQLLIDLPLGGKFDRKGQSIIDAATGGQSARDAQRSALESRASADLTAGTTAVDEVLQPFLDDMQALQDLLANTPLGLTDSQRQNLELTAQEMKEKFVLPIAEALGIVEEKAQSWASRLKTKLGSDTGTAAPEPVVEFTQQMLDAFKQFQDGIKELETKAGEERRKAVEDAAKKRNEATKKYEQDLDKATKDADKRRAEIITKSQQANEQAEIDHRQRLADIARSSFQDAVKAAARIDAVGLRAALERGIESTRAENQTHNRQKEQRETQQQEELADLETSRREKLASIQAGYAEELAEINRTRVERLNQINAQLRDEINQKNMAFAELHNKLAAESGNHNIRMLNIQQQGTGQLEKQYRDWITRMGGYAPQAAPATQQQARQATIAASNVGQQAARTFQRALSFDTGTGRVPFTGMHLVHANEVILDQTSSAMVRSMTGNSEPSQAQIRQALGGGSRGGGMAATVNVYLPDNVGDRLSRAEIVALAKQGAHQGIEEFWQQAAGGAA